jgi:hypothetical protein
VQPVPDKTPKPEIMVIRKCGIKKIHKTQISWTGSEPRTSALAQPKTIWAWGLAKRNTYLQYMAYSKLQSSTIQHFCENLKSHKTKTCNIN